MIESGRARRVLAIGVEKMTHLSSGDVGRCLSRASYMPEEGDEGLTFPGIFGVIAGKYFQKYGDQSDALAQIAAKNHKNGAVNPLAHMQKDFGYDFCRAESDKNPIVAGPLKRTDCSMISDGAAAIVLTDEETAQSHDKAIALRARAQANDFLPMSKRDVTAFEGPAQRLARRFGRSRSLSWTICHWSKPTTASPLPSLFNMKLWGWPRRSRARCAKRRHGL